MKPADEVYTSRASKSCAALPALNPTTAPCSSYPCGGVLDLPPATGERRGAGPA